MKYYLVKFVGSFVDDYDVDGYQVYSEDEWEAYLEFLRFKVSFPQQLNLRASAGLKWKTLDDYLLCLYEKEITKDEYNSILELFNVTKTKLDYDKTFGYHVSGTYLDFNPADEENYSLPSDVKWT